MRSSLISSRLLLMLLLVVCLWLAACGQGSSPSATTGSASPTATPTPAVDAYGTPITYPSTAPQRIVSLTPSTSEILGALHLDSKVVGVDAYTNYPADLATLPKVSSGFQYNVEKIVALKPDLVLSYGQDTKQYDSQLTHLGLHVVDLPSTNLTGILQEMLVVGHLTLTVDTATSVVKQLQQQIDQVKSSVAGTTTPSVLLESDDSTPGKPYVVGGGSFEDELVQDANGHNIFHDNTTNGGFPQVSDEAIISANPQYIILTEDPAYGGNPQAVYKRPHWSSIAALQMHHVYRVNPNLVGRPGPRLVEGLQCIAQLLHPDKFSSALPDYCTADV